MVAAAAKEAASMAEAGWIASGEAAEGWTLRAGGRWTVATAAGLDRRLRELAPPEGPARIDLAAVEALDSAGAWLLHRTKRAWAERGLSADFVNVDPAIAGLLARVVESDQPVTMTRPAAGALVRMLAHVGEATLAALREGRDLLGFFGLTALVTAKTVLRPGRLRARATVNHMEQVGLNALPIVGLLAFLIGVVIAYQGADQLRRFGAELFTVNLLGVSILRELGVLIASIIIAGRSGSAFTAQIGTMKVNQEVDAIEALGLDPIEILVLPRMIALVVTLPLVVFFADALGLAGGALMSLAALDISLVQFARQLSDAITTTTFWVGMVKAPVFALIIALVGCYCGLKVKGSAESVGRLTTQSVVESIFLVIITDAAFSILFSYLGI
jgi:phospholipid/cholesterol/gamma-HCH transport system permease protein